MQFSTNGLITFNDEFASGDVVELPRMSRPLVPLLAPLWTDINRGGELFARLFSDQETLSTVKQMLLRHNPTLTDYNPSQALVATWHMAELADGTTVSSRGPHYNSNSVNSTLFQSLRDSHH